MALYPLFSQADLDAKANLVDLDAKATLADLRPTITTVTAGDVAFTVTTYAVVTGSDLVVPGLGGGPIHVGDVIELGASGRWANGAAETCLDVATIVSAAPVHLVSDSGVFSSTGFGVQGWGSALGVYSPFGATWFYTVQAGDIQVSTSVLFRAYGRCTTDDSRNLRATASRPFRLWGRNLGGGA